MTVGILVLEIFIPESNSLKHKRMVLHSLKARLRNTFNVAVTQIDDEDKWQRSRLAIVGVERDRRTMNSALSRVIEFAGIFPGINVINHEMELI